MATKVPVTFVPAGVTVWVEVGATVLEAAKAAGILLPAPCGGRGVCGSCGVRIVDGALAVPDDVELRGLERAPEGVRLACRAGIIAPVGVRPVLAQPTKASASAGCAQDSAGALRAGIDLGTTSVAAVLIDAETGRELARASVPNRQQVLGADVLTRVSASLGGNAGELKLLAEQSVRDALGAAAGVCGIDLSRVVRVVVAGNSAMAGLLVGADVSSLAGHPFTPPFAGGDMVRDSLVVQALASQVEVVVLPPMAGFVGGDALAGVIAAGLVGVAGRVLLVDFGTNAEIVLAGGETLVVASAAAGPAFEGAGISCGGPAIDGAVTAVSIEPDGAIRLEVLGGVAPRWFSGSGLVSAVAALRGLGHISADGRMRAKGPLERHFSTNDAGVVMVSLGGEDDGLTLDQLDVRAFQLAKAAVRVGVEAVLAAGGVDSVQLDEVLLAGAFGSALKVDDLVDLGVLPRAVAGVSRSVGNAALDGAAAIALDAKLLGLAEEAARGVLHVDLAVDPAFNTRFLDAMGLEPYGF